VLEQTVVIVDYEAGNLASVRLALAKLGCACRVTGEPDQVRRAARVVFPGVGAAPQVMDRLNGSGLAEAIKEYAASGRPLLGICIGAQVIMGHSEEGDIACMGLIRGKVSRLPVPPGAKIPHMGWNAVERARPHPLLEGVDDGSQFYFVHSYAPLPHDETMTVGRTDYYGNFTSVLAAGNVVATQFHPERSGRVGLRLLDNFLSWKP